MGFSQGLSGLNGASKALEAIGNNVANAGTVGYKSQTANFSDIFAAAGGASDQVGIGVQVSGIQQNFSQGSIATSTNPLDLAINGGGLFRMSNAGTITYSRNGQFQLDKSGFLVNAEGLKLTGLGADAVTGAIIPGNYVPLQINNSAIPPQVTSVSQVQLNLDSRATPPTTMTHGSALATAAPASLTITAGVNDTITGTVDGNINFNVVIPPATYSSAAALATAVQNAINNTGVVASPPAAVAQLGLSGTAAKVDATITAAGFMQIASRSVGTVGSTGQGSKVDVLAGNGAATLKLDAASTPTLASGADAFDPTNTSSFTSSTAQTVFDSLGNPHTLQLYYAQTSDPGTWQMYTSLDGNIPVDPATSLPYANWAASGTTVSFNTAGVMKTPMPLSESYAVATGATPILKFNIDLTGTTQYGISFGTNQMLQDGFTSGKLSSMSVSADGIVQGSYSNGKNRNMGQVVLANFNNLSGLQSLGGNQWAETSVSGQPIPGIPGTGNLGLVQSGATEASNVDLTSALVDMITQQRAYQASAQSIKTLDQLMQTLVNLR